MKTISMSFVVKIGQDLKTARLVRFALPWSRRKFIVSFHLLQKLPVVIQEFHAMVLPRLMGTRLTMTQWYVTHVIRVTQWQG